jgi:hypothetical protein
VPESSPVEKPSNRPNDPAVEAAAAGRIISKRDYRHKGKRRSRKPQQAKVPPGAEIGAFSIAGFCAAHGGMSQAFFHKLVGMGLGPRIMKVGGRTMISIEAAAEWRRTCETATQQQQETAA